MDRYWIIDTTLVKQKTNGETDSYKIISHLVLLCCLL